ncbi:MAG: RNA polymerase sigma factor [Ilumatobacteraceae bacterium]
MAIRRPSIADLKRGDPRAWRWFVNEFGSAVTGYARKFGHPDPEEVTGSTLEAIARRIATFEGGHAELRSFVFSIAHARIVDDVRKRSRRQQVDVDWASQPSLETTDMGIESSDPDLVAALDQMPDELKHMLHLRYVEGLSTKETARAIGKSEVATRVALSRGMAKLRAVLESSGSHEEVES